MKWRCFPFCAALLGWIVFLSGSVPAQTPRPSGREQCTTPVARQDAWAKERFDALSRRVREQGATAQILFVGDSITQGWETAGREVWERYYAPRRALNLGVSGDHTQHVLWRLEHGHLEGVNPKVVVLLIGVNNTPDENNSPADILAGVTAVVQQLRAKLPAAQILLLGIFPFREDFHPHRCKALQVNQALRKLDDGRWVHFLDFGHLLIQADGKIAREIMPDFLHLSPQGYRIWAEAMEPKLAALLGEAPLRP